MFKIVEKSTRDTIAIAETKDAIAKKYCDLFEGNVGSLSHVIEDEKGESYIASSANETGMPELY